MPVLDTVKQIAAATFVWIQSNAETVQLIAAIGIGLVVAGTAAIALGATLVAVGAVVGSIMTLWSALTAAITFLTTPLGIVVVIIGAIVAAVVAALLPRLDREVLGELHGVLLHLLPLAVHLVKLLREKLGPLLVIRRQDLGTKRHIVDSAGGIDTRTEYESAGNGREGALAGGVHQGPDTRDLGHPGQSQRDVGPVEADEGDDIRHGPQRHKPEQAANVWWVAGKEASRP